MVWPRDPETGLLAGEELWKDRDMFAGIEGRHTAVNHKTTALIPAMKR